MSNPLPCIRPGNLADGFFIVFINKESNAGKLRPVIMTGDYLPGVFVAQVRFISQLCRPGLRGLFI